MNPVPAVQAPQGSTSGTPEFTAEAHACLEPPPSVQSDPQVSPEACAEALLKSESPDMSSILAMCENLPWEKPHVDACSQGRAFYAGGYRKGGIFGLRKHCKDFPRVIRVLTALLRRTVPSIPFTSIAVLDGVQSGPHKDLMNSSSPNIVRLRAEVSGLKTVQHLRCVRFMAVPCEVGSLTSPWDTYLSQPARVITRLSPGQVAALFSLGIVLQMSFQPKMQQLWIH